MFGSSTYRPVPLTSSRSSPFSRHLVSLSLCELFSVGPRLILNHSVGMLPVENTHTHTHTHAWISRIREMLLATLEQFQHLIVEPMPI